MTLAMKYLKIFFLVILIVAAVSSLLSLLLPRQTKPQFTIALSAAQSRYLGIEPTRLLDEMLAELKPRHFRLQADWDAIEPILGRYDFNELDNLIKKISQAGATVTLAVGRKLPHWPECHDPSWLKTLKPWEVEASQFAMVTAVINHYRGNPAITRWQVENEPLFAFGICPPPNWHRLQRERDLVKSLDARPILITDSGELSPWLETGWLADQVGATLYRVTWNKFTGYFNYFLPPLFYRAKAALLAVLGKPVIISELQLEPWAPTGLTNLTTAEINKSLSPAKFKANVKFFQAIGFNEAIVWGMEWWYYMKLNNEPVYWDLGRELFSELKP